METEEEFEVRQLNNMGDVKKKLSLSQIKEAVVKGYFLFIDKKFVALEDLTNDTLDGAKLIQLRLKQAKEIMLTPQVRGG